MDVDLLSGTTDMCLYDPKILKNIPWDQTNLSFRNGLCPSFAGKDLVIRPLCINDYEKGYMELLSQLTMIGDVSPEKFIENFKKIKAAGNTHYITVIEDLNTRKIVGSGTLLIEYKFIHSAASRGRLEDIIIDDEYRGRQLGKLIVEILTLLAKTLNCYKLSLECKQQNVKFYENHGYLQDPELYMVNRIKN